MSSDSTDGVSPNRPVGDCPATIRRVESVTGCGGLICVVVSQTGRDFEDEMSFSDCTDASKYAKTDVEIGFHVGSETNLALSNVLKHNNCVVEGWVLPYLISSAVGE